MVSIAGVSVADGPCHLLNTFSIIQITKSAGVKIKVNIAHPTHHLGRQLERGLTSKKMQKSTFFPLYYFLLLSTPPPTTKTTTTTTNSNNHNQQPTTTAATTAAVGRSQLLSKMRFACMTAF